MNCDVCPYRNQKKRVPSIGNPKTARYVLISEAPGKEDIAAGKPFQGKQGALLSAFFALEHWDIHNTDDFYLMNVLSCQVTNKLKVSTAVLCCRDRVRQELEDIIAVNPDVTIAALASAEEYCQVEPPVPEPPTRHKPDLAKAMMTLLIRCFCIQL